MAKEYGEEPTTDQKIIKYVKIAGILFIVILTLALTFYTIPAGHRGVVLTFGKPSTSTAGEGLNIKIPYAQSVQKVEVRIQKVETDTQSASKDLQNIVTTIALNYHIDPTEANKLYQEIGMNYQERIIDPSIQEGTKAITSQFNAEELITKRPEVSNGIKNFLHERLLKYHLIVDDFNIVNFHFSPEFDNAIEQKVTAEQLKLKADRDLERIKVEAQQTIESAKAQAESLRLQKQEISPDLISLRQIEVQSKSLDIQKTAIEKWNGVLPEVTSGVPFINFALTTTTK
jgi:regulator of protease activity HflC (stomatin/prohibitin superfamily)